MDNHAIKISLNSKVYDLEAVLNASHAFIERAYIFLDSDSSGKQLKVRIKPKKRLPAKALNSLRDEFMNELLQSLLRYKISKNNKKIREYIIGRALYSMVSVSDSLGPEDKLDYKDDPLGIAVPWEKKYGKNKKRANAPAKI